MTNELIKREVINDLPEDIELSYHVFMVNNQYFLFDENFFTIVEIEKEFYNLLKGGYIEVNRLPEDFLLLIADGNFLKWSDDDLIFDESQSNKNKNRYIAYYKEDFVITEDIEKIRNFINRTHEDYPYQLLLFDYNKELKQYFEQCFKQENINNINVKVVNLSFKETINNIDEYSNDSFNRLCENKRLNYWSNDIVGSIILRIYYNFPRLKTCYWYNGIVETIPENDKCIFLKNKAIIKAEKSQCINCWGKNICPNLSCCFEIKDCDNMLKLIENVIYFVYNNSDIIDEVVLNSDEEDNIYHCGYFEMGAEKI